MTPEEIQAMQEENAKLKEENKEKDERISTLEGITRTQSTNFKKLKDMTQKEKEALTESELEMRKTIETMQEQIDNFQKGSEEDKKKDVEYKRDKFISSLIGSDETKKAKILEQYNRLSDPEDTEDAVLKKVQDSAKLAGFSVPDGSSIHNAHNFSGSPTESEGGSRFSDSEAGKSMASLMGFEQPEEKKD